MALFCTTLIILGLLVLAIVVIVRSCQSADAPDPVTDAFRANVYVNSANLSGKTIDEAREMLQPGEDYTVNNIAITLAADGVSAVITGADIAAYTNLDEVLTTAFNGESNES